MTLAALSSLLIKSSLFAVVASLGMTSTRRDVTWLLRSPALLVRSLLAMQVLAPLLAIVLAGVVLPLPVGVKIALVLVSLAPVPPMLPGKADKAGGYRPYAISLLVVAAAFAIVAIPVSLKILSAVTVYSVGIEASVVAKVLGLSIFIPVAVGLAIAAIAPEFGRRASPVVTKVATGCLVLGLLPPLAATLPAIGTLIGNGTLAVCVVLALGALRIGHQLGGPNREDRTVLALSTAVRHPGMAIALANANFGREELVVPAILLYVIVVTVVRVPYLRLSNRRRAEMLAAREAYR